MKKENLKFILSTFVVLLVSGFVLTGCTDMFNKDEDVEEDIVIEQIVIEDDEVDLSPMFEDINEDMEPTDEDVDALEGDEEGVEGDVEEDVLY